MTNHTLTNGQTELERRRLEAMAQKATQTRPSSTPIATPVAAVAEKAIFPAYPEPAYRVLAQVANPVPPVVLDWLGVTSLDSLRTDHMPAGAARQYQAGLTAVRQWRGRLERIFPKDPCGRMFTVCSPDKGGGKTHMAQAVLDSFYAVAPEGDEYRVYEDGHTNFSLDKRGGRFFTAKDLMDAMALIDGDKVTIHSVVRPHDRIVIVDDVGREGKRKWTTQDDESQAKTTQQLYYDFFNWCYLRTTAGNSVNIFLTSNLMWDELAGFFNDATMSRINEMSPKGHVWEMKNVPDYRNIKSGR